MNRNFSVNIGIYKCCEVKKMIKTYILLLQFHDYTPCENGVAIHYIN